MLEQSFQTTEDEQIFLADGTPQENAIVNDSIKNITICKNVYKNLFGKVSDCLRQEFSYIDKKQLKNRKRLETKLLFY